MMPHSPEEENDHQERQHGSQVVGTSDEGMRKPGEVGDVGSVALLETWFFWFKTGDMQQHEHWGDEK